MTRPPPAATPENGPTGTSTGAETSVSRGACSSEYTQRCPGGRASSAKRKPPAAARSSMLSLPGGGGNVPSTAPVAASAISTPGSPSAAKAIELATTTLAASPDGVTGYVAAPHASASQRHPAAIASNATTRKTILRTLMRCELDAGPAQRFHARAQRGHPAYQWGYAAPHGYTSHVPMRLCRGAWVHIPWTNASIRRRIGTHSMYQRIHATPHWYTLHVPTRPCRAALVHTLCTNASTPRRIGTCSVYPCGDATPRRSIVAARRNLPAGPYVPLT